MSTWKKLIRSKFFVGGLAFMVLSTVLSYHEVQELFFGRDATARSTRAFPVERKGWLGTEPKMAVDYTFNDADGNTRQGHDELSADWHPPKNGPTTIRYLPRPDGRSRIADHHDWFGVALFGIGVLFMIVARHQMLRPQPVIVAKQKKKRK